MVNGCRPGHLDDGIGRPRRRSHRNRYDFDMRYRRIGDSDLTVSEISLGSWLTYGGGIDDTSARACVDAAFDAGINFIDTANAYARGAAESFLGDVLSGRPRDSYVLATKLYFPMDDTGENQGLSAAQVHQQIDESLRRLQTDHVDLYQCHRYDRATPLEETMAALSEVVNSGKARYIGFSEWSAAQIKAALDLSSDKGYAKFVSSQPQYSMLHRDPERDVIPLCQASGISQIVWSPLAQGALTGKYKPGAPLPEGTRATSSTMGVMMSNWLEDDVLETVQRLLPIAERLDRLLNGDVGVKAVRLIEVYVVGLQPCKRGVDLLGDLGAGQAAVVGIVRHLPPHLGGEDVRVPRTAGEDLTPCRFGRAPAVDVGRVKEVDPGFEGRVGTGPRLVGLDPARVGQPGAQ